MVVQDSSRKVVFLNFCGKDVFRQSVVRKVFSKISKLFQNWLKISQPPKTRYKNFLLHEVPDLVQDPNYINGGTKTK